MPTNQRLGPNDVNDLENGREPAIQLDEEKAVAIGQPNPAPALPLQHDQLLPQRRDLSLEPRLRLNGETKMARTNRRSPITRSAYAIRSPSQRDEVFSTHRCLAQLQLVCRNRLTISMNSTNAGSSESST